LSEKTGAPIVYGPNANPEFEVIIATDGQEFKVGKITIRAAYAGTYNGSTTYLLIDENGKSMQFFLVTPYSLMWETRFGSKSRFDDARTVSRNIIQFVKNKDNDFAR
jgi:hypothetical protein